MDDQATQLRELVTRVRLGAAVVEGAAVAVTSPPLHLVVPGQASPELQSATANLVADLHSAAQAHDAQWRVRSLANGYSDSEQLVWRQASRVLLVTDCTDEVLLEAYRTLKLASQSVSQSQATLPAVELVFTSESDPADALGAYRRLAETSLQFLGCRLQGLTLLGDEEAALGPLVERLLGVAPASETPEAIEHHSAAKPIASSMPTSL